MTTVSNHSASLIDPLARTKGGCANSNDEAAANSHNEVDDGYDGMMPLLGIKQEDEEIASVEADGSPDRDDDDIGGDDELNGTAVEKKILTAALVTSMADVSSHQSPRGDGGNDESLKRRHVEMRSSPNEEQVIKSESVDHNHAHTLHDVTPSTSEASSFSSGEASTMGDRESTYAFRSSNCNAIPQLNPGAATQSAPNPLLASNDAGNSKAIYPRASKTAATNISSAAAYNSSSISKRKIDAVSVKSESVAGKLMYHPPVPQMNQAKSNPPLTPAGSSFDPTACVPNPLAGMDTPSKTPQVTFQYMQYPQESNAPIPQPLAPPKAPSPPMNKEERSNSFSAIAESMSAQQYQTDNLMMSSTNELMSSQQGGGRGRIFSIDLDPALLDLVESVIDPPGTNAEDGPRSRNYSVTFDDDVNSHSGRLSYRRDRGFSFEFFSFGDGDDEPLPPPENEEAEANVEASRVRGDSIIFDPISFHDGGIHETSALMHVKHESSHENVQDLHASAVTVPAAPQVVHHVQVPPSIIHNPPLLMHPSTTGQQYGQHGSVASLKPAASSKAKPKSSKRPKVKSSHNVHVPSNNGQITFTTSSSSRSFPQSFTENTIHMPHGSDAAAAATAGMTPPSSTDGTFTSISHTSCPMELLNKGGRIGIYLPEERKARIAKFHDKRKQRMWRKKIKYDCRKKLADSRPRVKGRFVKRSDVDGEDQQG